MESTKIWKINGKKSILKTRIFEVFDFDCHLASKDINHNFYSIKMFDWVNIFALTEDNQVILVKQHRVGKDMVTLEVPAGGIDDGENPLDAAKRELVEETGYTSDKLFLLKKISVNPAIQTNTCYFYIALDCKKTNNTDFDIAEELEVKLMSKDELLNSINTELIDNSLAFLAVMLARDYLTKK